MEQQLIKHISKKVIKLFHISLMIVKNVIIANMEMKISVNIMPTVISSIIQKACQDTVDLVTRENAKLSVHGRHDPCIVPRAVPVIESVAAVALLDMMMD